MSKFEKFLLEFKLPAETEMEEEGNGDRAGLVNVYVEKLTQMTKVEDEYILTLDGQHLHTFDKLLYN